MGVKRARGLRLAQLRVPVGDVEEVLPGLVLPGGERNLDQWVPARLHRRPDEVHAGLLREQTALPRIARDAAADDVLPRGLAAAGERHDVIEVQVARLELPSAILAAVAIAVENVLAGEA